MIRLSKAPRGQFWLFYTASLFFSFGFSIFFFLFNLYLLGFNLTERSLGLIGGLMAFGSILGTIPAGICAERFGIRPTLVTGLSCTVVFSLLAHLLCRPARTIGARCPDRHDPLFLGGLSLSYRRQPDDRGAAAIRFQLDVLLGHRHSCARRTRCRPVAHLAAAPATPGRRRSRPARWTLECACGAAALAIIPLLRLRLPGAAPRVRLSRLSNPFLRRFLPAMAVWALVTGSFPPFANVYFVHHLGLSLQKVGFVFSLSQLVQFLAVLGAPLLFRRTGLVRGVVLTQIATAAALASLAFIRGGTGAVWLYAAYMAIQYMNEPGIYSLLMDQIPPGERSSASASTFFVTSACQALASAVMGVAIVRFGYPPCYWGSPCSRWRRRQCLADCPARHVTVSEALTAVAR